MVKTKVKEKTKESAKLQKSHISNFFINELKEYSSNEYEIEMDDYSR